MSPEEPLQVQSLSLARVIGGHMVSVLVAPLGARLGAVSRDWRRRPGHRAVVIKDHHIVERLLDIGYEPLAGNRFARTMSEHSGAGERLPTGPTVPGGEPSPFPRD